MRYLRVLFALVTLTVACLGYSSQGVAEAQAVATSLPTTSPTTSPTTAPTTAATTVPSIVTTSVPAYTVPAMVLGTPPPAHVMTGDYYGNATLIANCAVDLAPYVTYFYPWNGSDRPLVKTCGLKEVTYLTPSMPQTGEQEYAMLQPGGTYAAAAAKDCAGNVITTYSGKGYLLDPHAANAQAFYQAVLDYYHSGITSSGGAWDAVFSDNSDEIYSASAQPCDWNGYADWTSSTVKILSSLNLYGAQLFLNVLSLPEAYSVTPVDDTVQNVLNSLVPTTVAGGEQEGFIYDVYPNRPVWWATEMNTEIGTVAEGRIYWAYANHGLASIDPTSAVGLQWRSFMYASWLLAYDPSLSIYQTWFNTPSGLRVMPETGLVATQPLQTAKSSITELQATTSSPYIRQFGACYYRQVPLGPCAAVANPSAVTESVTLPQYTHSVLLHGSDPLDGGWLDVTGPAVTQLPAESGAILLP